MKFLPFLLCLLFAFPVQAQDGFQAGSVTTAPSYTFETEKETQELVEKNKGEQSNLFNQKLPENGEITIVEDKYASDYATPSVQNLSKLYWKMNAIDLNNDKAIDNFLKINECDLYQEYYHDDFEWLRIRTAGRKMIVANRDYFTNKFKVMLPIDFGRYDMQKNGFPLINDTAFIDLRRIEIGGNHKHLKICGDDGEIEHYPKNLILILSRPFVFDFVKLDEHIAQAYIIKKKYSPTEIPKGLAKNNFNRLAFARIRISFDNYQGTTIGDDSLSRAVVFGKLDGIDIFEDAAEKNLLTSIDF